MKKLLIAATLVALSFSGANMALAQNTNIGVDTNVDTNSTSSAGAIAQQTMNVKGAAASAVSTGSGMCGAGAGIQVLAVGISGNGPSMKCIAATGVPEMVKLGILTPAEGKAIWLKATGFKLENRSAATATVSTSSRAPAKPQAVATTSLRIMVSGQSFTLSGESLARWNAGKTVTFQMPDDTPVKANKSMM